MRMPAIVLGVLMTVLGAYTVSPQLRGSADRAMERNPSQAATPIPYNTRPLAGSWGGSLKNDVPIRLVVEDVRPEWALVHFAWGKNAENTNTQGAIWTRAKILPDGRLCISYPLQLIFTLSEDSRSLVGTKVHADPFVSVLLARAEEEQARFAFIR